MTLSEPEIGAVVATLVRTGGLAATAPLIGDPGVSIRARLMFTLAIGLAVGATRPGVPFAELPLAAVVELAVGLLTGLCARFVLAQVAIAGQLMGLSLGLGFASQYDVHAGESAGTLRTMLMAIAGLAFLAVGGFDAIVRSVAAGPAHVGQIALLGPELVRQGTAALGHGLALAAPVVLAALVANIGLAVMNRAAPAANVFSIALAGVLILGGVVLLATAAHLIGGVTETARASVHQLE